MALGRILLGRNNAFTVPLRLLGPVSVAFMGIQVGQQAAGTGAASQRAGEELTLILGSAPGRGRLVGNAGFVGRLVSACLAVDASPVVRALSPGERGVFAALVATILTKAGLPLQVDSRAPLSTESLQDLDGRSLWLDIGTEIGVGRFRLDLPRSWLGAFQPIPPTLEALNQIGYVGRLELARTTLARADWRGAEVGDVVVFDGCEPLVADQSWPCVLRFGVIDAQATFTDAGLSVLSPLHFPSRYPCPSNQEGVFMSTSIPPVPKSQLAEETADVGASPQAPVDHLWLAEAPVEVVAEWARLELRSADLLGLVRGSVVPLGRRSLQGIALRVGDRIWARGDLVNVDGELGLRITELPT